MNREWEGMSWSDREEHLFGFLNRPQFDSWFFKSKWIEAMSNAGYRLNEYEVDGHVIVGHAQVAFKKAEATFISSTPLDTFNVLY